MVSLFPREESSLVLRPWVKVFYIGRKLQHTFGCQSGDLNVY